PGGRRWRRLLGTTLRGGRQGFAALAPLDGSEQLACVAEAPRRVDLQAAQHQTVQPGVIEADLVVVQGRRVEPQTSFETGIVVPVVALAGIPCHLEVRPAAGE